jgi:hypothetical protein
MALESQGEVRSRNLLNPPLLGMPYNFCFAHFSVKRAVWLGEVFWPQQASPRPDFFKHTQNTLPGFLTVPNFIEIVPMVWISIADLYNDFYIDI